MELIKRLNEAKIVQDCLSWEACIPERFWWGCLKERKLLDSYVDERYEWYEMSIIVFEIDEYIIGVKTITSLINPHISGLSLSDIKHTLEFFEMREVRKITYKIK